MRREAVGASAPARIDGYAPIRDYAAIGDGRTVALVARDGAIDWLPIPYLDSAPVFAAVLDTPGGGRFVLEPKVPYLVERRYLPGTNVLESVFRTDVGAVRVTDAMTLPDNRLGAMRELQRQIDGLAGRVPLRWRVEPRFGYGLDRLRPGRRAGVPVLSAGGSALAVSSFDAGDPTLDDESVGGRFDTVEGSRALLALSFAHHEPLVLPARSELEARLRDTAATWRRWSESRSYEGRWPDAVLRSVLALKLLVAAPFGSVAAAATTSLPELLGGERNWDYRYSWIRDSAFTLDAFLRLGCSAEAHAYFWWLMHASQLTHPRLRVLYRLDGGTSASERELALAGYRESRPVRVGNAAADQVQLDTYGELLQTAWLYADSGARIDRDVARRLAEIADYVCEVWRRPDSGIWEVRSQPTHFTQSKMMCWIALDRALALADRGVLRTGSADRWRQEHDVIADFIERRSWSDAKHSYVRVADGDELDASVLFGVLFGYGAPEPRRLHSTVEAIRRELGHGPYVYRYTSEDGLEGGEGAFIACSFWLVEALARVGRVDEAAELMDELVGMANDVGLYAEEIDPDTGEFLGNIPQGLSHLALIRAAHAITGASAA